MSGPYWKRPQHGGAQPGLAVPPHDEREPEQGQQRIQTLPGPLAQPNESRCSQGLAPGANRVQSEKENETNDEQQHLGEIRDMTCAGRQGVALGRKRLGNRRGPGGGCPI